MENNIDNLLKGMAVASSGSGYKFTSDKGRDKIAMYKQYIEQFRTHKRYNELKSAFDKMVEHIIKDTE